MSQQQFPCESCGAEILFAPGSHSLECPYCGARNEIEESDTPVTEQDYLIKLHELETNPSPEDLITVNEVHCDSCGANTTLEENVAAGSCPFCDTPFVLEPHCETMIKPHGLLPFKIDSKTGQKNFQDWVNSLWFAPNKIKEYARQVEKLQGVYLAHWTYDTKAFTTYMGERGEHYYQTQTYRDSNGNRKTRRVKKTRWYPASGRVRDLFDDILVVANDSLPRKYTKELEPWDLHKVVPYSEEYLSGFKAEHYSIGLEQGFGLAQSLVDDDIQETIRRDIGGDVQRIHSAYTDWQDVTFKHILLPVWVSAYHFQDEVYRVVINARSGEVQGERPYSWVKITFAVIATLLVVAVLFLLFK